MILFRLKGAVEKVLKQKQCGFRKGRRCVDQIFTLRLIIDKCLNFIDYEQAFDSVNRRALSKVF